MWLKKCLQKSVADQPKLIFPLQGVMIAQTPRQTQTACALSEFSTVSLPRAGSVETPCPVSERPSPPLHRPARTQRSRPEASETASGDELG